jgi:Spy/CpxP family protein refolding chaperone
MLIMRALLVAAALCVAVPALAQSTDQTQTPAQPDQSGKPHSGHHHHKKPDTQTDGTDSSSQGH